MPLRTDLSTRDGQALLRRANDSLWLLLVAAPVAALATWSWSRPLAWTALGVGAVALLLTAAGGLGNPGRREPEGASGVAAGPSPVLPSVGATGRSVTDLRPGGAAGLDDRGEIAPGQRADLVRVRQTAHHPLIREVWVEGTRVA